ncbi:hypothetical protein FRC06_002989 [Ceratobasidium sp. 370]|nr:hypothetical protein FRC06_002989 [Ceratobasidium sp. 370]
MPPAPTTKTQRLECPYHGRGRLATREEDIAVHEGQDWLFWVDPYTGLGQCDDEASRKTGDHGYGEGIEVLLDTAGMAYRLNGEPLVARDAKIGPYHVNVKGKHKILARGRARP